MIVRDI